jgi:hypothetical protein
VIYPGSTPVGNATLVVANVLTCNKHSHWLRPGWLLQVGCTCNCPCWCCIEMHASTAANCSPAIGMRNTANYAILLLCV